MIPTQYGHAAPRSARIERAMRTLGYFDRIKVARLTPEARTLAMCLADQADAGGALPPITYTEMLALTRIRCRTVLNRALADLVTANLILATGSAKKRRYTVLWTAGRLNVLQGGAE